MIFTLTIQTVNFLILNSVKCNLIFINVRHVLAAVAKTIHAFYHGAIVHWDHSLKFLCNQIAYVLHKIYIYISIHYLQKVL
jgi:hypothetical protein